MPHYKSMFEANGMLYACHLAGRDVTLTIASVVAGEITGEKGRKSKKPIVSFRERPDHRLAINKTNGKCIAGMYGTNTDDWIGKRITLYATTTEMGGETVECIRVRPRVPPAEPQAKPPPRNGPRQPAPPVEPDPHGDPPPPDDVELPS